MSSTKNILMLSLLPAVFLISCALSSISGSGSSASQTKSVSRDIASQKMKILTYQQIQKMPSKKVYDYYMRLYSLMNEIERFQSLSKNGDLKSKKSSSFFKILEESFAQGTETQPPYSMGNNCLIGGYWGTWQRKATTNSEGNTVYRMTCDSPNRCTTTGSSTPNNGHLCNPKFFTYQDAQSGTPFCADLTRDLTTSHCRTVVERFYREQGGDSFADHFRRSVERAIVTDARYQGISPEVATQRFQQEVYSEYQRIAEYCGQTEAEWRRHSAGQDKSCFPLMQQYAAAQEVIASPSTETTVTPPATIAEQTPPAPVPQQQQPIETTRNTSSDDTGLGPFACIKQGLSRTGNPGVSNKFIALFAVNAKYRADMMVNQNGQRLYHSELMRKNVAIINVVKTLTDVGLCKSRLWDFGPGEAAQSTALLTMDRYNQNSFTPGQYQSLYQLPWGAAMPNQVPGSNLGWERASAGNRKRAWQASAPTPAHMCVEQSRMRLKAQDCHEILKSCRLPDTNACGTPPSSGGGSSNNNNNNGGNNGNNNGGNNNGGNDNGGSPSPSEVGSGSNAESGHGSNNGASMGSGPPGM